MVSRNNLLYFIQCFLPLAVLFVIVFKSAAELLEFCYLFCSRPVGFIIYGFHALCYGLLLLLGLHELFLFLRSLFSFLRQVVYNAYECCDGNDGYGPGILHHG